MSLLEETLMSKFDLSNYAMKTDLKNISHIDISNYATKIKFSWFKN